MFRTSGFWRILAMTLAVGAGSNALAAEDGAWSVGKSSGEVWMSTAGAQQVSLGQAEVLKQGDTIRTGRNGRVLLVRGEETILVSPNSVIGLPTEKKEGLSTTIMQQAGSILLDVEKRNVRHFEVETPYLAAVVKGTQFRVTVSAAATRIDVIRGQVEVADFRSGQIAQVMPGQVATAFAQGKSGLSLSGSGTFSPIEQGQPRPSSIERIPVPKLGLSSPRHAANGQLIRAVGHGDYAAARTLSHASFQPQRNAGSPGHGVTRISGALGEVRLNFHAVTHGLAHSAISTPGSARSAAGKDTVWSSHEAGAITGASNGFSQANSNNGGGSANTAAGISAATISGGTGPIAAVTAAASSNGNANSNGNGNGNANANGNGNGNGNNGNGNGKGNNGNGNNGNGNNGNGNNGNGNNGNGNGNNGNGNSNGNGNGNNGNGNNGNGNNGNGKK
jgi:FecR protein